MLLFFRSINGISLPDISFGLFAIVGSCLAACRYYPGYAQHLNKSEQWLNEQNTIAKSSIFQYISLVKFIITILLLTVYSFSFAQISADSFIAKNYRQNMPPTERIEFSKKVILWYPSYVYAGDMYRRIASGFLDLKDTVNAVQWYEKCIQLPDKLDSSNLGRYFSASKLSSIYFAQKEYRKALTYFTLIDNGRYKLPWRICRGTGSSEIFDDFKRAICYQNLGKSDSAITKLISNWIFEDEDYNDEFSDSMFNEVTDTLVSFLVKKFGKCKVKDELEKAINEMEFNIQIVNRSYSISSHLMFFNNKVDFSTEGGLNPGESGKEYYYTKQRYIDLIRKSKLNFKILNLCPGISRK